MLCRTFNRHEVVGRIDQRNVGEGLRKISELTSKNRIVLLGQQANVIAQPEQTLEEIPRLLMAAGQRIIVREPERTRHERSLTRRQSIDPALSRVSEHQASINQFPLDRTDG